jgi:hypothetical protein
MAKQPVTLLGKGVREFSTGSAFHHCRPIWSRKWHALMLAALFFSPMLTGCLTLPTGKESKEKPPPGKPVQIATTWENEVMFLPDTEHDGKEMPCLGGRLYLFGNEGPEPIACEGTLDVKLLRNDQIGPDGEPKVIEVWQFPTKILQQMCSKDMIGWGYSLALPWATYDPNLKNLTMSTCFHPKDGFTLYARSKLNFQQQGKVLPIQQSVRVPGTVHQ